MSADNIPEHHPDSPATVAAEEVARSVSWQAHQVLHDPEKDDDDTTCCWCCLNKVLAWWGK